MINKRYSAYFEYLGGDNENRAQDYQWWSHFVERILIYVDNFHLECLPTDQEGLWSCAQMGVNNIANLHIEGRKEIWEGNIVGTFIRELMNDAFNENGYLKWSAIILRGGEKTILTVSRSGDHLGVHGVTEEDLEFFAIALHSRSFMYYYWDEVSNGETVYFQPIYSGDGSLKDIINAYRKKQKKRFDF